jgi:hypothetical protein
VTGEDPFDNVQATEFHGVSFLTSSERQEALRKEGANRRWSAAMGATRASFTASGSAKSAVVGLSEVVNSSLMSIKTTSY